MGSGFAPVIGRGASRMRTRSGENLRAGRAEADAEHPHTTGEVEPQQEGNDTAKRAVEDIEMREIRGIDQEGPLTQPDQDRRAQRADPDLGEPRGPSRCQSVDHEQSVE